MGLAGLGLKAVVVVATAFVSMTVLDLALPVLGIQFTVRIDRFL